MLNIAKWLGKFGGNKLGKQQAEYIKQFALGAFPEAKELWPSLTEEQYVQVLWDCFDIAVNVHREGRLEGLHENLVKVKQVWWAELRERYGAPKRP